MTPFQMRPVTADDVADLADVYIRARREAMPYLPVLHTRAQTLAWMRGWLLEKSAVTVAADGDGILGFSGSQDRHLDHLYVDPSAQARGVGSLLLGQALDAAGGALTLHVFQRNTAARTFYERRGFRCILLRDGSTNEEREPDALYVRDPD